MSTQTTHHEKANTSKDIFQVSKKNFEKYVSEVEKTIPQYNQTVSNYQKTFLDTWRNTVDFVTEATEKTIKFYDDSVNAFVQFNTNLVESWFATFRKASN